MDHLTDTDSRSAEKVTRAPQYALAEIVTCMRISARMLEIADDGLSENNHGQANLLRAAADDLELRKEP